MPIWIETYQYTYLLYWLISLMWGMMKIVNVTFVLIAIMKVVNIQWYMITSGSTMSKYSPVTITISTIKWYKQQYSLSQKESLNVSYFSNVLHVATILKNLWGPIYYCLQLIVNPLIFLSLSMVLLNRGNDIK